MDDTCYRCLAAIADVCHSTCNGSCGRNTAEDRRKDVGNTLTDEFLIGIVLMTDDTVSHCSRKERLDGAEHSDGDGWRDERLDALPVEFRHYSLWH